MKRNRTDDPLGIMRGLRQIQDTPTKKDQRKAKRPAGDKNALDQIQALMNATEWDSDTTSEIARIVMATGRTIREPNEPDEDGKPSPISAYLAEIGATGGAAKGAVKKRGSKKHYREMQLRAAATRKANNAARKAKEDPTKK